MFRPSILQEIGRGEGILRAHKFTANWATKQKNLYPLYPIPSNPDWLIMGFFDNGFWNNPNSTALFLRTQRTRMFPLNRMSHEIPVDWCPEWTAATLLILEKVYPKIYKEQTIINAYTSTNARELRNLKPEFRAFWRDSAINCPNESTACRHSRRAPAGVFWFHKNHAVNFGNDFLCVGKKDEVDRG